MSTTIGLGKNKVVEKDSTTEVKAELAKKDKDIASLTKEKNDINKKLKDSVAENDKLKAEIAELKKGGSGDGADGKDNGGGSGTSKVK